MLLSSGQSPQQYAVVGHPVAHSRSPFIHAAFAKQVDLHIEYRTIDAPLDGFEQTVQTFFNTGGQGLNVTLPFKQQAFELADRLTERARVAGAVNTLWQENGQLHGDNTDGAGLAWALHLLTCTPDLSGLKVLILGAGGAVRGVIAPLLNAGIEHIDIANRTYEHAVHLVNDLTESLQGSFGHIQPIDQRLRAIQFTDLSDTPITSALPTEPPQNTVNPIAYDIVINATSSTLSGAMPDLPDVIRPAFAYDMAYGKPSEFLIVMQQRGALTADGLSMLVAQAAESFKIWHGNALNYITLDIEAVLRDLRAAIEA